MVRRYFAVMNTITKRPAAVIVPILINRNPRTILMTKRSHTLYLHSGNICFPGGKKTAQDVSLKDTALREFEEETGISKNLVKIIESLPSQETVKSNFLIYPFCGVISDLPATINFNEQEVSGLIEITLFELEKNKDKFLPVPELVKQTPHHLSVNIAGKTIHGVTASILKTFINSVTFRDLISESNNLWHDGADFSRQI